MEKPETKEERTRRLRKERQRRWALENPEAYKARHKRAYERQKARMAVDPEYRAKRVEQNRRSSLKYYHGSKTEKMSPEALAELQRQSLARGLETRRKKAAEKRATVELRKQTDAPKKWKPGGILIRAGFNRSRGGL